MKRRPIAIAFEFTAAIAVGLVAAYASGLSAAMGAGFGGLESGGWNWQFLPSLYLGWATGFILSIISGIFLFWTERPWYLRLLALLLAAPTITLAFSTAYYFVALLPERKARAANMVLLERGKDDPAFVDSLVKRARSEELTPMERIVIGQTLGTKSRYSDSDVAFLLDYFQKDISAVAAIMSYQNVSEAQLRMIYQRYRDTEAAFSRIYDELIEHPQTPVDILEDIATNSRCPEYMTSKAKAALANK